MARISVFVLSTTLLGGLSTSRAGTAPAEPIAVAPAPAPAPAPTPTPEPVDDDVDLEDNGGSYITYPADELGGCLVLDDEATECAAPAEPKSGDVLYHVDWYGHGLTTIVADIAFAIQTGKVEKACKDAGGELKNVKVSTSGIFYYYDYGSADCVKK